MKEIARTLLAGFVGSVVTTFLYLSVMPAEAAFTPVPKDAILHFATSTCPAGWTELVAARGRYIIGMPSGGTLAGTDGTALTDLEDRPVGQHNHTLTMNAHNHGYTPVASMAGSGGVAGILASIKADNGNVTPANVPVGGATNVGNTTSTGTIANTGSTASTNAPYIQYPTCKKN